MRLLGRGTFQRFAFFSKEWLKISNEVVQSDNFQITFRGIILLEQFLGWFSQIILVFF